MMKIILLDGTEKVDQATIGAISDADVVIDADGKVLRTGRKDGPTLVNLAELERVLTTQARPRRTKEADATA